MLEEKSLDELLDSTISVSVNWEDFYTLRRLAREDTEAQAIYSSILEKLIFLGRLSLESKNHYVIEIPNCDGGGNVNPNKDGEMLYIVNPEDAVKIKRKFVNTTISHYQD